MANSKISDLAALTTPAAGDLLTAVDVSDTSMAPTGTNKKLTVANLGALFDAAGAAAAAAAVAVSAHEGAGDPHPQYLTAAEGNAAYVPVARTITAGDGLTGGGDLSDIRDREHLRRRLAVLHVVPARVLQVRDGKLANGQPVGFRAMLLEPLRHDGRIAGVAVGRAVFAEINDFPVDANAGLPGRMTGVFGRRATWHLCSLNLFADSTRTVVLHCRTSAGWRNLRHSNHFRSRDGGI